MMHKNRIWQVKDLPIESLATELQRCTWCCCSGFRAGGMLWLNDATSPDGAQEYAVIRESDGAQVESVTVSWCKPEELQAYIDQYAAELATMAPLLGRPLKESSLSHGPHPCAHCA